MTIETTRPDLSWRSLVELGSTRDELVVVPWFTTEGEVLTTVSEAPDCTHAIVDRRSD